MIRGVRPCWLLAGAWGSAVLWEAEGFALFPALPAFVRAGLSQVKMFSHLGSRCEAHAQQIILKQPPPDTFVWLLISVIN